MLRNKLKRKNTLYLLMEIFLYLIIAAGSILLMKL